MLQYLPERGKFFSGPHDVTLWAVDRQRWVPIQVLRKAVTDLVGVESLSTEGCETACLRFLKDIVAAAAAKYAAKGVDHDGIVTLQSIDLHAAIGRETLRRRRWPTTAQIAARTGRSAL